MIPMMLPRARLVQILNNRSCRCNCQQVNVQLVTTLSHQTWPNWHKKHHNSRLPTSTANCGGAWPIINLGHHHIRNFKPTAWSSAAEAAAATTSNGGGCVGNRNLYPAIIYSTRTRCSSSGSGTRTASTTAAASGARHGWFGRTASGKHEPKKGFQIGNYKLGKRLGKGSFGIVRVARNLLTGDEVAIKIMKKEQGPRARDSWLSKSLMAEITAMAMVRHPYIVHLYEVLSTDSAVYLVMELMQGGSLGDRLKRAGSRRMPEATVRRYFQQLIDAVTFCHRQGVFHRDLKPDNLLLDARGTLKVADFGMTGLWTVTVPNSGSGSTSRQIRRSKSQTRFTSVTGTAGYVAPEVDALAVNQYNKHRMKIDYAGAPADLWSCGVILFQLLCAGRMPYQDSSVNFTCVKHRLVMDDLRIPAGVTVSVPAHNLLKRLLQLDVSKRITAEEIYNDPWFRRDYSPPDFREISEVRVSLEDVEAAFAAPAAGGPGTGAGANQQLLDPDANVVPPSIDAFRLLSQSVPVDMSPLLEQAERPGDTGAIPELRLKSALPARDILRRLQAVAQDLGFTVQVSGFKLKLDRQLLGARAKGPICIVGEVFGIPGSDNFLVILRRITGDFINCDQALRAICRAARDDMVEITNTHMANTEVEVP